MLREIRRAKRHGIVCPVAAWRASRKEKVPFWVTCAFLSQESGGGHNEFGHDPTIFIGAGRVTKDKYLRYKRQREATGKMQGVGPMQLTWYSYQDAADMLGGCWKPYCNIRQGLRVLKDLRASVAGHSWVNAARRYNGSGPAADAYARQMADRFHEWRFWLR